MTEGKEARFRVIRLATWIRRWEGWWQAEPPYGHWRTTKRGAMRKARNRV